MKRSATLIVVLLGCGAHAWAQTRPLKTEPATTQPKGALWLQVGGEIMGGAPNPLTGRNRTVSAVPTFELRLSPADNVELEFAWPGLLSSYRDPDFGDVTDWGDVTIRSKLRFLHGPGWHPTAAFRVGVTLPQTKMTEGLGPDTLRSRMELLVSGAARGSRWHINVGLAIQDDTFRPHTQRDYLTYGVAFEQRLGERLAVLAEAAGESDGEVIDGPRAEGRLGVRLAIGRVLLDAALRRGLSSSSGAWGATLGVAIPLRRRVVGDTEVTENTPKE